LQGRGGDRLRRAQGDVAVLADEQNLEGAGVEAVASAQGRRRVRGALDARAGDLD
jgi:hypothetical protein